MLLTATPSPNAAHLSSVTRLSGYYLTRGFASQSHGWFAIVGEGSKCFPAVEQLTYHLNFGQQSFFVGSCLAKNAKRLIQLKRRSANIVQGEQIRELA
jgi:hypothetical protein